MCMGASSACMSLYHMHAWCLWRSERASVPGAVFGCWELNLDPLDPASAPDPVALEQQIAVSHPLWVLGT